MKALKRMAVMIVAVCMLILVGCGDDFTPTSMEFEIAGNSTYSAAKVCDDKKLTKEIWNFCTNMVIDETAEGKMGSEYIYAIFSSDKTEDFAVFTLYSNGSCCLGEDFETFYTVENGEELYKKLLKYYEQCPEKE